MRVLNFLRLEKVNMSHVKYQLIKLRHPLRQIATESYEVHASSHLTDIL